MTNTHTLSRRIVAALDPDGTRWPHLKFREVEDVAKVCECGAHDSTEVVDLGWGEKRKCCEVCGISHYGDDGWEYVTTGTHIEGPDLAQPENLHLLLEVADSVGHTDLIADWNGRGHTCFIGITKDAHKGFATTRSLAVLAAVCAALGIEVEA